MVSFRPAGPRTVRRHRKWESGKSRVGCGSRSRFIDGRDQRYVEHSVKELLAQRINGIALGYEDLNDHDRLRLDPVHALLAGKEDLTGEQRVKEADRGRALAGRSTLNRLARLAHIVT